jgi:hypothetical protein
MSETNVFNSEQENDLMNRWFLLHNYNSKIINKLVIAKIQFFFDLIASKKIEISRSVLPIYNIILKYTKLKDFSLYSKQLFSIIIHRFSEECIPIFKNNRLKSYNEITQKNKKHKEIIKIWYNYNPYLQS